MTDIKELRKKIREYERKYTVTENSSEADKLIAKIRKKKHAKEEFFETQNEVRVFLKSNASEADKQKVLGYTESLSMICAAIREGRLGMDDK
ncbi:MAG: hypothetical protein ACLUN0_09885 [Roseburia sp.]